MGLQDRNLSVQESKNAKSSQLEDDLEKIKKDKELNEMKLDAYFRQNNEYREKIKKIEESEQEKVKELEEKIRSEFSQKIQDMETEVKVLTEAKVKLNSEIDAVVLELKNRDESVEKSVEVMEKRIQEITQENQKFKQEKMEIEKNKGMLEVIPLL